MNNTLRVSLGLVLAMCGTTLCVTNTYAATSNVQMDAPNDASNTTANAASIEGVWRTIDDRTGFAKALVKIEKKPDGQYQGMIIRVLPRPEYTPKKTCQNCPKPFTDQPIEGLQVIWGLREEGSNTKLGGGYVIDPLTGKIYNSKAVLSKDGRRLAMRGYTDMSALGRSQTWIREGEGLNHP